jgi:hypothetical protein
MGNKVQKAIAQRRRYETREQAILDKETKTIQKRIGRTLDFDDEAAITKSILEPLKNAQPDTEFVSKAIFMLMTNYNWDVEKSKHFVIKTLLNNGY